ncbi:MAG TPA: hypothetical protein DIC42_01200 [Holosporales bacterium]|nr:hypothetical protein [Holosporales bacterium]
MIEKENNIYFVENIIPHYEENVKEAYKFTVVLLNASEKYNLLNIENDYDFLLFETTKDRIENTSEGNYVKFLSNELTNANNTPIARRNLIYNNFYRGRLLKNQKEHVSDFGFKRNIEIFSYHINVGHGNCSLIVVKNKTTVKIWMIDCSDFDYKNRKYYNCNINTCLNYISQKFRLKRLQIDKFFLTHPHFDHYSGIERLINLGIINNHTEFYLNLHYCMPSKIYNHLLRNINILKPTIIEPISTFSTNNIEIWHPHFTTIRTFTSKYATCNYQVEQRPNNSSVVYCLNFGEKSILFPGDLETEKWDTITHCPPNLKACDYFVISHHGSLNGHIRNHCPVKRSISNLSHCVKQDSTQILMGRDGAYQGIYSKQVLNDFNNIVYSEKDPNSIGCQYIEIDWQTNQTTWR